MFVSSKVVKKAVLLNDTSYELHHGCEKVVKNIKNLLILNNIKVIDTNPTGHDWKNNHQLLRNISESDIILVNGEGTLHHSQLRAKELITFVKYIKDYTDIPIVLINSTYQKNNDEMAACVKLFDLIYVRETLSKDDLSKYNIKSKVVPDMTFYSQFNLSKKSPTEDIGASDSVYVEISKKIFELCKEKEYKFLPALTASKKIRLNGFKNIIKFVKYNIYKNIKYILHQLRFRLFHEVDAKPYYMDNYQNYIQEISSLKFLIAGRYHSLCFSLKTLTPFVAIKSNSHKIEGMLEDVGIGIDRVISEDDLNQFRVNNFNKVETDKILKYINEAPLKIEAMFKEIRGVLDK